VALSVVVRWGPLLPGLCGTQMHGAACPAAGEL
jgi:hypothetical protein